MYKQNSQQFKTKNWLNSKLPACIYLIFIHAYSMESNIPCTLEMEIRHFDSSQKYRLVDK